MNWGEEQVETPTLARWEERGSVARGCNNIVGFAQDSIISITNALEILVLQSCTKPLI